MSTLLSSFVSTLRYVCNVFLSFYLQVNASCGFRDENGNCDDNSSGAELAMDGLILV